MAKRKTDAQFKQEVYGLVGDEYTVMTEYTGRQKNVLFRHNACGNEYYGTPANFFHGNRCPACSKVHRKTPAEFAKEVKTATGDEYAFLEDYIDRATPIKVRHNNCGQVYKVSPSNFLRGERCPKCVHKSRRLSPEDFAKRFKELVGDEYTLLTDYIKSNQKISVRHNICGTEYEVTPNNFLKGKRCLTCSRLNQYKSSEAFAKEVKRMSKGNIIPAEPYRGVNHVMTFTCLKHNCTYGMTPHGFMKSLSGGCPLCKEEGHPNFYGYSGPARDIRAHLVAINEPHQLERMFDDCKHKALLPFDFYLPKRNLLIEYDGQQHFYPVVRFDGAAGLARIQATDSIKNLYAKLSGIHLIRIPYTEKDKIGVIDQYLAGKLPKNSPYVIN